MKVDPNQSVDLRQETVLCESGRVVLYDGTATPVGEITRSDNAFAKFCASLDPNKQFIVAIVPDEADKEVYFKAREAAHQIGIHMQAPVETAEHCRIMWQQYVAMKEMHQTAAQETTE